MLSRSDAKRSGMNFDINREATEGNSFPLWEIQLWRYVIRSIVENKARRASGTGNPGNASGSSVIWRLIRIDASVRVSNYQS
jgi:hypothetical protein